MINAESVKAKLKNQAPKRGYIVDCIWFRKNDIQNFNF